MTTFFQFLALGLAPGAVYALLGQGIVLIYRGSGVINFAQGAVAMMATYLFVQLGADSLPAVAAFVLVLLMALLFGAWLYVKLMRPLRAAPLLAKVVVTLGIVLALQSLATLLFGTKVQSTKSLLPEGAVHIFGVIVSADRLCLLGIAVAAGVLLWAFYRFTQFGLVTRAVAENEEAATVLGYSPDVIAAVNWSLGIGLAASAGILISPIVSIDPTSYTLLVIPALSAALLGRFTSFGITTAAGICIGIAQSLITRYVSSVGGLADALPFLVVILAMALCGQLIPARQHLQAVRRPPLATPANLSIPAVAGFVIVTGYVVLEGSRSYQSALSSSCIFAITALSLVVLTGYTGQLSLAQITFSGVGAFFMSKFMESIGIPFLLALILAAIAAIPVGLIIGIPALRVRGTSLAIITLGAAVAISDIIFSNPKLGGGYLGLVVGSPALFGLSIDANTHPDRFASFAVIVLAIVLAIIYFLRRSRFARQMLAVRDNERAAAAAGVSVIGTKMIAFGLSSFIAGLAGALQGSQLQTVGQTSFNPLASLFLVSAVYICGIGSLGGAVVAGVLATGGLVDTLFSSAIPEFSTYYSLLGGLGVALAAIHSPDGFVAGIRGPRRGLTPPIRRPGQSPPDQGSDSPASLAAATP